MPAPFNDIINSRVFKFVVGEEADGQSSEISIHEGAVSHLSKPLYDLTKGDSPEAREGQAVWKDVRRETFEGFAQFAYTGDYSIPEPEIRSATIQTPPASPYVPNGTRRRTGSEASISTVEPYERPTSVIGKEPSRETLTEKVDDDSGTILNYPIVSKKHRKKKKGKASTQVPAPEPEQEPESAPVVAQSNPEPEPTDSAQTQSDTIESETVVPEQESVPVLSSAEDVAHIASVDFYALSFPVTAERDNYHGTCEPSSEFDKEKSYSRILLCHASLYVLGDVQLIHSLKSLALFKLHKTLCTFQLDRENTGDITNLARYAYSDKSRSQGGEDGIGVLRVLVCQYLARYANELSHDTRFLGLLAEGGQIVIDFFKFQLQMRH